MNHLRCTIGVLGVLALACLPASAAETSPDYGRDVAPIFRKYCAGCHNGKELEGGLNLDSFPSLMKGGETGKVVEPGRPDESRLIRLIEKLEEPSMPPEGNEGPSAKEISLIKAWIKGGARAPSAAGAAKIETPKIVPTAPVRRPITALAVSPDGKRLAVARAGTVELRALVKAGGDARAPGGEPLWLTGHAGTVNDLAFSEDGTLLLVAGGEPGRFGEATLWRAGDWRRLRTLRGHEDAIYAVALSPDGKTLATGSYDQKIKLWDAATGKELRQLDGHNGAVFDLAFRPDGKVLASASGDATVKLWQPATGERLDTLVEPEKEQYTLAFRPDGRHLAAAGVDKRIRVWRISNSAREGTNRILYSRFAHEEPVLRLAFTSDGRTLVTSGQDRTIKLWEARRYTQLQTLEPQPDWPAALAFTPDAGVLAVGRMDGSLARYDVAGISTRPVGEVEPITGPPTPKRINAPADKPATVAESEPNDTPAEATRLPTPGTIRGVLFAQETGGRRQETGGRSPGSGVRGQSLNSQLSTLNPQTTHRSPLTSHQSDTDLFRFSAKAGETWIIETNSSRSKSPADTKIEVLHADGRPVLRYLLQAVRESYISFRPIDSTQNQVRVKNWEEMDLNQFMYMNGEVCKLFRMPQGPDSGFLFYTVRGKRKCYFDTSATVHALEEPVYIVEAYPPGTELIDNGLPVFPLYFANDDDGERKLGTDSRLTFTAPADGEYLVRVTDTRGFGGEDYKYTLTVRRPRPDFNVTIGGKGGTIGAGSGKRLKLTLDRIDNFDGPVRIDISGVPKGFHVASPVVVQRGHYEAESVINVDPHVVPTTWPKNAKRTTPVPAARPADWSGVKVTAAATIGGKEIVKNLGGLGTIKVAPRPKVIVHLEPDPQAGGRWTGSDGAFHIEPGTSITAMLRVERHGFGGELNFDVDNLPHGVIVDDIGLSGILIREGENRRRIFLTAAEWVPATIRQFHAVSRQQDGQASRPLIVRVYSG